MYVLFITVDASVSNTTNENTSFYWSLSYIKRIAFFARLNRLGVDIGFPSIYFTGERLEFIDPEISRHKTTFKGLVLFSPSAELLMKRLK